MDLRFTNFTKVPPPIAGLESVESYGKTRQEVGLLDVSEEEMAAHEAQLLAREPFSDFRFARVGADGEKIHLSISGKPVFDTEGNFLGYTVLQAADGPAALEVMAAAGAIDLLLTDMILPRGMNGRDVANAFREQYPASGVLYSSGYTREVLNRRGGLEDGVALMNKPYQTHALAKRVREVMDRQE